ncbi:MAG: hypothetical protein ACRCXZ_03865 [Patescibacteria group bacterium]
MLINLIRNILALTPFVRPTMDKFYKLADKDGFLNRIPLIGGIINLLPPLKWLDSKLKYPILTIGRIILALVVVYFGINFTINNQQYHEIIDNKIIPTLAPEPKRLESKTEENKNNGFGFDSFRNSIGNAAETAAKEAEYQKNIASNLLAKNFLGELFRGSSLGVLIRGPLIWLAYSLLFFLFGNTQGQLDSRALSQVSGLRSIGTEFVKNIGMFVDPNKLAQLEKKYSNLDPKKRMYNKDFQEEVLQLFKEQK